MAYSEDELWQLKRVINRTLTIVIDNKQLAEAWGFYLFNAALDQEKELRNKITSIYVLGMLDTMERRIAERLDTAQSTAQASNLQNLRAWCDRVSDFRAAIAKLLTQYSYDEFVFLQFMRNQLVHGWRAGEHEETFKVRWFDPATGHTAEQWVGWQDRLTVLTPFFDRGLDVALAPLRDRLLDLSHDYWKAIGSLQAPGYIEEALRSIYGEIGVSYDRPRW